MLNSIRNWVNTLGAKILLGLLVLAFAAWGIEGVFAARGQTVVATVGDAEIESETFARAFEGRLQQLRQSTGSGISAEDARRIGYDQIVINQLATQTALDEEARALGIAASDGAVRDAITGFPQFRDATGRFDRSAYEASLRRNRLRQAVFEETIRADLAREALLQSIGNGTTAPRALAETLYRYRNEERSFEHIALEPGDVDSPGEPTEQQLSEFHQENAARFTAPEYRKIAYVALTIEDVADGIERTNDELREVYDAQIARFTTPERRSVEQMVFDTEAEAKEAFDEIDGGEPFAKVAEGRGLTAQDVSLGTVTRDELPDTLADVAFAADDTGLVAPVETPLGWSLMNIRSIQEERVTSFDDAKATLAAEINLTEARRRVPDMSISLDDQLAGGFTLEEAAEQSGSRYGEIEAVDETGRDADGNRIADLPQDREFLSQVFSTDVNEDPYLIEGTNGDYFALIVEEITPATLRPIDTIRDELTTAWELSEREKALATLTGELVERLRGGDTLADIAEDYDTEVKTAGPGTRTDRSLGLSADLLETVFSIDEGEPAEGLASNGLTRLVGVLSGIDGATSDDDVAAIDRSTEEYAAQLSQDMVDQFSRSARERHPLILNPQAIEAVFSPQHGGMGY